MNKIHRKILYKKKILRLPDSNTFNNTYYIMSSENKLIDKYELESARIIISKELRKAKDINRKKKNFWVCINFLVPYTKKSSHSRMGKGKGGIDSYKSFVHINTIIFKFVDFTLNFILKLFKIVSSKLSFSISLFLNNNFVISS